MKRLLPAFVVMVLVASACGGSSAARTPSPSPSPIDTATGARVGLPDTSPPTGGVVIKSKYLVFVDPTTYFTDPPRPPQWEVFITDLKGNKLASAHFDGVMRAKNPFCTNGQPQPEVRVAAGVVFFVDHTGVVRELEPSGSVTQVAAFPVTADPWFSYAVSPDGRHVMGIVLASGAVGWTEKVYLTTDGGAPVVVGSTALGANPSPTVLTGWDYAGPVATTNSWCVGSPSYEFDGQQLVHLDLDGNPVTRIGGAGCVPMDENVRGDVVCRIDDASGTPAGFSVRRADGKVLWTRTFGYTEGVEPKLAPDSSGVAWAGVVYLRDQGRPASFSRTSGGAYQLLGWSTSGSVVAASLGNNEIGLAAPHDPLVFKDLGFAPSQALSLTPGSIVYGLGFYLAGGIA